MPNCTITDIPTNICAIYDNIVDNIDVFDDHILINDTFPILRTDYFTSKLNNLDNFDGFSPRWIFPQTRMVKATDHDHEKVATQTMLIIDSLEEIKIGVGLNSWPPAILEKKEIQIPNQVAAYLGVGIGD